MPNSTPLNATDLVMADLEEAIQALEAARGSPKEVRRAFSRFVDLTQRLTSVMRAEFHRITGRKWNATTFAGWNSVTEFFKWLRNHDQHDSPIRISVHERHFYEVPGFPGGVFPFEGTWVLSDQLDDGLPDGITFTPIDQATGAALPPIAPVRVEYQYLIQWPSEESRLLLQAIGTTDVHQLSAACIAVLREYHGHYISALGT